MSCTVIICSRNRASRLDRCLGQLARLSVPRQDVLVIDNASSDGATREVAARHGVRCVVEPVVGLSRARNRGVREAHSEIVAFIDDDCVAQPGWLTALLAPFTDPRVGAVAGQIRSLDSGSSSSDDRARIVDANTPDWFAMTHFGGLGDGANMAFRRAALEEIAGFDERLGLGAVLPGGEEHYAFFAIVDHGYRVARAPGAVVHHEEPADDKQRDARDEVLSRARVAYLLFLVARHPRHAPEIVRHVVQTLRGAVPWALPPTRSFTPARPRTRRVFAYLRGAVAAARTLANPRTRA